jgi:hypothetical protein
MKIIAATFMTLALAVLAFTQVDSTVIKRAADAVPVPRSRMTDPDSFVLEAVHIATTNGKECLNKWCSKKTDISVTNTCFTFRSHNAMGGYRSAKRSDYGCRQRLVYVEEGERQALSNRDYGRG